jgi:hypothetical protein
MFTAADQKLKPRMGRATLTEYDQIPPFWDLTGTLTSNEHEYQAVP